jgi:hypothetical protein
MARWTVVRGEQQLTIDVTGDQIALDIPTDGPFTADTNTAQEIRTKLGAAIGAAQGPEAR